MTSNHKYALTAIGAGEKLWRCEVCGEDVRNMFFQIELLKQGNKWTCHNCRNLLGHKDCLLRIQKGKGDN